MTDWALDIETDVTADPYDPDIPAGLDPRAGRITSVSWGSKDIAVVMVGPEVKILTELAVWLHHISYGDRVFTWNGGGFDWPYIAHRMRHHDLVVPFTLLPWGDERPPKYDPLPTSGGTARVEFPRGGKHVDLAWCYKQWCEERENVRWSLKSVALKLGIPAIVPDTTGADVGDMASAELAAYNLSDVDLTLRVGKACDNTLLDHFTD